MPGANDAEFTLLTPRGSGGVAVVAVVGPGRRRLAESVIRTSGGQPFAVGGSSKPRVAHLWLDDQCLDEILVVELGERIELHLHGSAALVDMLERRVGPWSELTCSAAERLVRGAQGTAQLALGLQQGEADWSGYLAELRQMVPTARRVAVLAGLERSRVARAVAEVTRLVLCGPKNAGKSTLMNRLLFRERALAAPIAGTTRDPVREPVVLSGYPYEVVDTAGEGPSASELDRQAVELGRREREGALCLVVVDGSREVTALEWGLASAADLWVRNKMDLGQATWPCEFTPAISLSCANPAAGPEIRGLVGEALRAVRSLPVAGPVDGSAALDREQWAQLEGLL